MRTTGNEPLYKRITELHEQIDQLQAQLDKAHMIMGRLVTDDRAFEDLLAMREVYKSL